MPANFTTLPHFSVSLATSFSEVTRRTCERDAAEVGEARLHLGITALISRLSYQ
jgi:hypothetical protein